MKLEAMQHLYHAPQLSKRSAGVEIPVTMDIEFNEPVGKSEQVIAGVRRIKETGWYRSLKRDGIHFTPLGSKGTVIFVAVGTAAALGTGFVAYKALKENQTKVRT